MSILDGFRVFFGSLFVLFVPGLAWSYVFFPRREIDWIERLAISFGLSIALVSLSVFWLNWLLHVKITLLNTSLLLWGLTGVALLFVWARRQTRIRDSVEGAKLWFRSLRRR